MQVQGNMMWSKEWGDNSLEAEKLFSFLTAGYLLYYYELQCDLLSNTCLEVGGIK